MKRAANWAIVREEEARPTEGIGAWQVSEGILLSFMDCKGEMRSTIFFGV